MNLLERIVYALTNVYGYTTEELNMLGVRQLVRLLEKEIALAKRIEKVVQITRQGKVYVGQKYTKVA